MSNSKEVEVPETVDVPNTTSEKEVLEAIETLDPEDDIGNTEYKRKLQPKSQGRLDKLITQMNFRLTEGDDEAIYLIGIDDDGTPLGLSRAELEDSLQTLNSMVQELDAKMTVLSEQQQPGDKWVAHILVRRVNSSHITDIRVAVGGHVNAGKSSSVGVLTHGKLDNGRGSARLSCFNHPHEVSTGQTSSVSLQILGFNDEGKITNYSEKMATEPTNTRTNSWQEIVKNSSKILSFVDLCGHEKYLRTTISGISSQLPSCMMLVVATNLGVTEITKEHIRIALALRVPVFGVITKMDMPSISEEIKAETTRKTLKLFKSANKMPILIKNEADLMTCIKEFNQDPTTSKIAPVFQISNVTGMGIDYLKKFLNCVPGHAKSAQAIDDPFTFHIDQTFSVPGAGTVVSGIVTAGRFTIGDKLMMGPNSLGNWVEVSVRSIHFKRTSVDTCSSGQSICFALKRVERKSIKRGMVICAPELAKSVWRFKGEIVVVHHHSTIGVNFQPVIHCLNISQSSKVVEITEVTTNAKKFTSTVREKEKDKARQILRSGDRAKVIFQFMYKPEFVTAGTKFIFREGNTRGMGEVLELFTDQVPLPSKRKSRRSQFKKERAIRRKEKKARKKANKVANAPKGPAKTPAKPKEDQKGPAKAKETKPAKN